MNITLEALSAGNWLKVCGLSVSEEQKRIFPIANVYWIGISRYEEHSELFAIKSDGEYAGLIGGGPDEDGISGYINPLMIDERFQRNGIAKTALRLMIDLLISRYHVPRININHRRENNAAGRLYESLGFAVYAETENEICRSCTTDLGVRILSLRDDPEREDECRRLLSDHFNEFTSDHPSRVLESAGILPQGYFMMKNDKVIGWVGIHEREVVSGRVYGWEGTPKGEEIFSENLSPWITPLLVHPDERGNRYGKMLLDHARTEAGRMGYKTIYLTTGEINYYEKYGFREVGLTCFTWGRPTKIYNAETKING